MGDKSKLVLFAGGLVGALALREAAGALFLLCVAYLARRGMLGRSLKRLLPFSLPLAMGVLLRALWGGDALDAALKMLSVFFLVMALTAALPPHRLVQVLGQWKFPLSGLLALALRYVFALEEEARSMHAAIKLRGGFSSPKASMTGAGLLAGAMLERGFDRAKATTQSMALRGGRP